jgi:hypothetical protein
VGRNEADRSAGLIKEEYETQAGRTEAPTARSPVAGTVELVKPLHGQWPSLPRGGKTHRFVGTELEPYIAVAFCAAVALKHLAQVDQLCSSHRTS